MVGMTFCTSPLCQETISLKRPHSNPRPPQLPPSQIPDYICHPDPSGRLHSLPYIFRYPPGTWVGFQCAMGPRAEGFLWRLLYNPGNPRIIRRDKQRYGHTRHSRSHLRDRRFSQKSEGNVDPLNHHLMHLALCPHLQHSSSEPYRRKHLELSSTILVLDRTTTFGSAIGWSISLVLGYGFCKHRVICATVLHHSKWAWSAQQGTAEVSNYLRTYGV